MSNIESRYEFEYLRTDQKIGGSYTDYDNCYFFGKYSGNKTSFDRLVADLNLDLDDGDLFVEPRIQWISSEKWIVPPPAIQWKSGNLFTSYLSDDRSRRSYVAAYFDGNAIYLSVRGTRSQVLIGPQKH